MHLKWDQALCIALLWIRVAPRSGLKLGPFEIVCETLWNLYFRSALFRSEACVKNKTICTIFKANTNHLAQVWSLQVCLCIWQVLTLIWLGDQVLLKTWKTWEKGPLPEEDLDPAAVVDGQKEKLDLHYWGRCKISLGKGAAAPKAKFFLFSLYFPSGDFLRKLILLGWRGYAMPHKALFHNKDLARNKTKSLCLKKLQNVFANLGTFSCLILG